MGPRTLTTARLLLRPLDLADAPAVFAYARDPAVTASVLWDTHRSIEDSVAFLTGVRERYAVGDCWEWGITWRGALVGTIGLHDVRRDHRRAELGYTIARAAWGKGIATEAVGAVVGWAFAGGEIQRLVAVARAENVASQRVLEKNGFVREGTLHRHLFVKGAFWDLACYGLVASGRHAEAPVPTTASQAVRPSPG